MSPAKSMTVTVQDATDGDLGACKRCSNNAATMKVRQDSLCTDCFTRYITTKVIKRMEAFRVRTLQQGLTRKLLLPLSLGISSACLLHILNEHLEGQAKKSGRPGYSLHVVHVSSEKHVGSKSVLGALRSRYPSHEYSTISLWSETDQPCEKDSRAHGSPQGNFDLPALLASVTSPSSRADLSSVGLRRKLVAEAQRLGCEGILWGDTTTSLAEKILSETAKGRGFSLPWLTADGEAPMGVAFYFPMKDLLRRELPAFARAVGISPDLFNVDAGVRNVPVSARNNTIDGLMKDYFESVEESYPSIVANVVRTSGKLNVPKGVVDTARCDTCSFPIPDEAVVDTGSGEIAAESGFLSLRRNLCYGCRTTLGVEG